MQHNFEIKNLSNTSMNEITTCVIDSFADYDVSFQISEQELLRRFTDADVQLDFSYGAFVGDKLIGMVVIGMGTYREIKTAYNILTCVLPTYHRNGISMKLIETCIAKAKEQKAEMIMLEVITSNHNAIKTYRKANFIIKRTLLSFKGKSNAKENRRVFSTPLKDFDFSKVSNLIAFPSTFENTLPALQKRQQDILIYYYKQKEEIKAVVAFDKTGKSIRYYAGDSKRTNVSKVIGQIAHEHGAIFVKNIDQSDSEMIKILVALEWENVANQYEMQNAL